MARDLLVLAAAIDDDNVEAPMTVAVLDRKPQAPAEVGMPGLRLMVLARIACDEGATRPELARELAGIVDQGAASRLLIETELAQLVRAGMAIEHRSRFTASQDGLDRLHAELSLKVLPRTWNELRDIRLVAKALGIERDAPSRLKGLAKPDVLRAEILIQAFGLKVRGAASSSRLRAALALVALERAFGDGIRSGLASSTGLNAKASRVLAGQLLRKPQDPGTDKRLVARLAAEVVDAPKMDSEPLRLALLKRLARPAPATGKPSAPRAAEPAVAPSREPAAPAQPTRPRPAVANRPDIAGFVKIVKEIAAKHAEGWAGNRKALVSRVFDGIAKAYPSWGLTLIEFKAMLAECHRVGHLALATADLKDKRQLDELRQSAISYKNTVWHLVRVDT